MALLFMEGFDHFSGTADTCRTEMLATGKWAAVSGSGYTYTSSNTPYADGIGRALYHNTDASGYAITKSFSMTGNKLIISFWWKQANTYSSNYYYYPFSLQTSSGADILSMRIYYSTDDTWLRRGSPSSGTSIGSGFTMPQNTWVHFGIEVDLTTDATGRVKLFINGLETQDIQNIQSAAVLDGTFKFRLGAGANTTTGSDNSFDDLVIMDGSGATNNSFEGIMRVLALKPNSDFEIGSGMTPYSGGLHSSDVDQDLYSESEATYVSSGIVGERNLYGIEDAQALWGDIQSVMAVEVSQFSGTDNEPTSTVRNVIHDGVNTIEGQDHIISTVAPTPCIDRFETAPDGTDWTLAALQSLKVGHKNQA